MLKVYTAGYMTGEGSDRFDWRAKLRSSYWLSDAAQKGQFAVEWLNPGVPEGEAPGAGDSTFYAPRDIIQIKHADLVFAYFDLKVAKCLGAAWELGLAYGLQKQIIMVDRSKEVGSLDLCRAMSDVVVRTIPKGLERLRFIAKGL